MWSFIFPTRGWEWGMTFQKGLFLPLRIHQVPSLKLTASLHLKIDLWKFGDSWLGNHHFRCELLVSGRVDGPKITQTNDMDYNFLPLIQLTRIEYTPQNERMFPSKRGHVQKQAGSPTNHYFSGDILVFGGGKFSSATPAIFCNKKRFLVGVFFPNPFEKYYIVKMGENLPQFSGWK